MKPNSPLWNMGVFHFDRRVDGEVPNATIHYHDSFEVYYLEQGTCWYFIDKKSYRLTEGDIALIPAGVIHKTSYETATSSRSLFSCVESFIPESARKIMTQIPYFPKTKETAVQVENLFRQIQREYENPDEYSMDVIRTRVSELFLMIARECKKPHQEKQESPIVEKAVGYIREHYMENVTLHDVAEHCYVSREHLSRIFKKETGFGFNEYLNVYRLKKANAILSENPKSKVSQVAVRCGFGDSNYFSKQYKKVYGVAPTQTRRGG